MLTRLVGRWMLERDRAPANAPVHVHAGVSSCLCDSSSPLRFQTVPPRSPSSLQALHARLPALTDMIALNDS